MSASPTTPSETPMVPLSKLIAGSATNRPNLEGLVGLKSSQLTSVAGSLPSAGLNSSQLTLINPSLEPRFSRYTLCRLSRSASCRLCMENVFLPLLQEEAHERYALLPGPAAVSFSLACHLS